MGKENVTVELEEELIRRALELAAKRGTSLSELVEQRIKDLVDADARGARSWTREELYDCVEPWKERPSR